ncbi:hypothetical protein [Loktanella salsilacus]|uniref:hypothetical protein n=1 Tax=Loktanella salsilacus TaxID=195913 RepID=UPI003736AB78
MTYEEFQAGLDRADLSIRAFAEIIGMRPNSISNYAKIGMVPSHLAIIVTLMAEMSSREIDFKPLINRLNVDIKRPRGSAGNGNFRGDLKSEGERQARLNLTL